MSEESTEVKPSRDFSRQIWLFLGVFVLIAAIVIAAYVALRPRDAVLFQNLKATDASTILAELDREKISYRLSADGTTILVPENEVRGLRLHLMTQELPLKGTVGFELFNNSDLGVTEFAQKVNYQRALQGELARTIMSLDGVDAARVHLALPESTLFRRSASKPKASVAITTRDEVDLAPATIRGIQRLVAAAVPDLDVNDVTVLDQRGGALAHGSSDDGLDEAKLGEKMALENYYSRKVLDAVEPVVGPGKALVTVDATINFDQVKVTQETTDGQSAPRPAASTHASSSQTAPSATDLSVDDESVARPHDVSSREHTVHRLEQIVSSPGSIHKLTVGVLLKGPLDASTQARVGELVAAAVGLVPSRGDSITTFVSDRFAMPAPAGSQLSKFETAISASHLQVQNSVSSDSVSHLTYVESNWLFIAASLALAAVIAMVGILLLNGKRRLSAAQRADYIARLRKLLEEEGANEAART